jgi:hypothetical protein
MKDDKVRRLLKKLKNNANSVRFSELSKICNHFFGPPRQSGTSHRIYKTPWPGDPRINIQKNKGMAMAYQVKQVLLAIDKLEAANEPRQ